MNDDDDNDGDDDDADVAGWDEQVGSGELQERRTNGRRIHPPRYTEGHQHNADDGNDDSFLKYWDRVEINYDHEMDVKNMMMIRKG